MRFVVHNRQLTESRTTIRDYVPEQPRGSALLWVHGGGFAGGSIDMAESDAVARQLAAGGRPVRTVEYRLAPPWPEHGPLNLNPAPGRYPAAQDDVTTAFLDVAPHGAAFLGGASAGACIAASVAVRLREEGGPPPLGLVLAYGVFHARLPMPTGAEDDPPMSPTHARAGEWVERMTLNYAGSRGLLADPKVFPGAGAPTGLPDTLILDAERDSLRASGQRFAEQLRESGVCVTETVVPGSSHGFLNDPVSGDFEQGMLEITRWLERVGAGNRHGA
ncbi:alpha/beta hydrolase [Agromyces endophyticus]|uniref:alpha/beta hydrolase fold domain-containing protein n=1 Tax=Agromyces sp. H17E-10 TaxID=2932244 RepID=UPI001FD5ADC2|nr:alpha/beta hydrolase fold domain-containing protein [Agromyces sp. H17E-10]UOQ89119.1 alpha/beta hydrolase [Agromyces sp. H17E-10]